MLVSDELREILTIQKMMISNRHLPGMEDVGLCPR